MSHSGSGQSVSEDSTESQSGSTNRRKTDFGRKHRKIVRILTVVAYIISVSTAAVLLSAYYVFLWNPTKPSSRPTDSPSTMAMASIPQTSAYVGLPSSGLPLISFATAASQSFSFASSKHPPSSHRASKSPVSPHSQGHGHDPVTPHPVIPTPQTLIMQTLLDSTTIISTPPAPPAALPAIPTSHILTPQKPTKTNQFPSGQNTTATTATTNTTNTTTNTTAGPSTTTSTTTTKPTAKSNRPTNKLRIFPATTNSLDLATNTNSTLTH